MSHPASPDPLPPARASYPALHHIFVLLVTGLALAACASVPEAIDVELPDTAPTLDQARLQPDAVSGQTARFGGRIAGVENRQDETLIEVVGHDLQRDGRPSSDSLSRGRFLAVFDAFLDPAVYKKGRQVTVVGELDGTVDRKVGEHDYPYPRLLARSHHLWPEIREVYHPPLYYDPWFHRDPFLRSRHDPFFPHGPRGPFR